MQKNIMEVNERFSDFQEDELFETLKTMKANITKWFDETKAAFDNSDEQHAQATRENSYQSEKECDRIAWAMLTTERKDAVALALLFRFYKRISAHLGNICTSVVMPLDKLDYYEKPEAPNS